MQIMSLREALVNLSAVTTAIFTENPTSPNWTGRQMVLKSWMIEKSLKRVLFS